ncbi:pentatricopeptide repeat-containing protein At1g73400, mitochondrial-like [Asparagus officinalis]|uniref:pentatricopeptide repeat-containing protein At1g73400, mitochondrial-like n=1 Tax=Asparagus officinalis TaxID=4686 RepID=UPI00098E2990|nr:pentatricopeptide repeat-containing protein At1g73400, mitochondrial-like [Asparagus officinalis]
MRKVNDGVARRGQLRDFARRWSGGRRGDGRPLRCRCLMSMVERVGWTPKNVPAYDSFLCTLVKGGGREMKYAMRYLGELKAKGCYPGMKFFRLAMEELVKTDDARGARVLWETLVGRNECYPDAKMYSSMIKLQCHDDRTDEALKYLDDMVLYGAFPDAKTYNVVLERLLKRMRTKYAAAIFDEMVLNEFVPSESNCVSGIKIFLDARDWDMGLKVWKCMVDNGYPLEESGNLLVTRSKECDRLPEGCKVAEDMIDRRVKLTSANLSRLRGNLVQMGKIGNLASKRAVTIHRVVTTKRLAQLLLQDDSFSYDMARVGGSF